MSSYLQVAVEAPINNALTYLPLKDGELEPGDSVLVPLGSRKVKGVVLQHSDEAGDFELKAITEKLEARAVLPKEYIRWGKWLARYYIYPVGQVFAMMYPPLIKKEGRKTKRESVIPQPDLQDLRPNLTEEQQACLEGLHKNKDFSVHLIHGVTGSGKTEIYLQMIEEQVAMGKTSLVLVPEISLTPQLVQRFSSRFPDEVAVIHSHLTGREKTNQWWSVLDGKKKILIGARSALFCPIKNLGLIVIDEEHEPSFKQEEQLKYHARDAAIMLAKLKDIPVLLGSATPSLESWKNALDKKFYYHEMSHRVAQRQMPNIEVVDMREERQSLQRELPFWLSQKLYEALQETLDRKEQSILFLNRRGMAQTVLCSSCGYVYECPNCAISLTLHSKKHLVCHYCDYSISFSEKCSQCGELDVSPLGLGTELIQEDLGKLFPEARLARADRDEISGRTDMEDLIKKMESLEIDILVGTQMIAKGLDFKNLTLVGLVMADVGFNIPNFRSSERSYHLITQVCGRAGRHVDNGGNVIIQTYNTEHTSITHTLSGEFPHFCNEQLEQREELFYPPYSKLISFRLQGIDLRRTIQAADILRERAEILRGKYQAYELVKGLGPAPAPLAKVRNNHRYHYLIKGPSADITNNFARQLIGDKSWVPAKVKLLVDIDPVSMI